jgi:chromosome partitioning protein
VIRLVISNQRGGVAKTTTAVNVARYFADQGQKVLIIDTDPQGSVGSILGLRSEHNLHSFVIKKLAFRECLVAAHPNIDVMCSARDTVQTEAILMGETARELTFQNLFPAVDRGYDVVLIDVAPSISLLQTCAMLYARQLLIPVSMDGLSLQGAIASIETARMLSDLFRTEIKTTALLPVMVDRRYQMTEMVMESLKGMSERYQVPLLPVIRTDANVTKSSRQKQFLIDYDPRCKALEDYTTACRDLSMLLKDQIHVHPVATPA